MRGRVISYLMLLVILVFTCAAGSRVDDVGGASADSSPPGRLAPGWEVVWTAGAIPGSDQAFTQGEGWLLGSDDTLMRVDSGFIDIFDLATGRFQRRLDVPPDVFDVNQAGGVLLVESAEPYGEGPWDVSSWILTAYDVFSGIQLWQQRDPVPVLQPGDSAIGLGDGDFVVANERGFARLGAGYSFGQDPYTGRFTWTREGYQSNCPDGELSYSAAATRNHALLLHACESGGSTLEAIDPQTGRVVWRQDLGPLSDVDILGAKDLIAIYQVVDGQSNVTVVGDSGRILASAEIDAVESWPESTLHGLELLGMAKGTLYFANRSDVASESLLYALPVGGDEPSWQRSIEFWGFVGPQVLEDGTVVTPDPRPHELDISTLGRPTASLITGRAGQQSVLPLPLRGEPVGAGGDLLITVTEEPNRTRVSALRLRDHAYPEPEALRGVPSSDWPEACGLLSDRQLARLGDGYVRVPVPESREVFGVALPHETYCRFGAESLDEGAFFEIRMQWVANSPAAARQIAADDLGWSVPNDRGQVLDAGTYLYQPSSLEPGMTITSVIMARGLHVIVVSGRDLDLVLEIVDLFPPVSDPV